MLRFDALTKTGQPELHRYWTTRGYAATRRLFRLVTEVLAPSRTGLRQDGELWKEPTAFPGRGPCLCMHMHV